VWQIVYKFLGASLEKEDNHWAIDAHSNKKEIKGITYFQTAGSYDNRYNENVIVAMVNYGPGEEGPKQKTPVTGDRYPFPELSHWSDIVALEFAQIMKNVNKPTDNLKGVWQRQVMNPDTQSLAAYLYGVDTPKDMGRAGEWPVKDYAPDSDEFAALLASPNGVGVAYLLLQHRDLLGTKNITSIKVWREEELHILFSVGNLAMVQRRSVLAEWEPDNESEVAHELVRQGARHTNGSHDSALIVRAPSNNGPTVDQTKQVGAYFIDVQNTPTAQLESCMNIAQSTFTTIDQLGKSGWTDPVHEAAYVADTDIAITQARDAMHLDWKGDSITRSNLKHTEKTTGADGQVYYPTQAYYENWYCVGAIVADENESPWKARPALADNPVDGKTKPFPPLRQWSDAVFLEYQDVCGGDVTKMKTLQGVLRNTVMNKPTLRVLRNYLGTQNQLRVNMFPQDWPGTVYKLGDKGFEVAMGIPGGKGVAYLLATHCAQLGWKEVYQVQIFADRSSFLNILYLIRDHVEETQQNPRARRQLRDLRIATTSLAVKPASGIVPWIQRRAEELDYDTALKKGLYLLCLIEETEGPTAQSQWTDVNDLAKYGWRQVAGQVRQLGPGARMPIAKALNDEALGISNGPNDNVLYTCEHDSTTEVDHKTYPLTGGEYGNILNVESGVIIVYMAYGPDHEGQRQFPEVTGDAVVPLKQWSDVTFLMWQEHAVANIKSLRYVFVTNIVNDDSYAIIKNVLDRHKTNIRSPWPELELEMHGQYQSDARALLGTPNGRGVAYLLATHKQQLGFKVINSVTIFDADGHCLCFKIVYGNANAQIVTETEGEMLEAGAVEGPASDQQRRRSELNPSEVQVEDPLLDGNITSDLKEPDDEGAIARSAALGMKLGKCLGKPSAECLKRLVASLMFLWAWFCMIVICFPWVCTDTPDI